MTVEDLDCGDNSCYFKKTPGGMRTNGGCRCFDSAGYSRLFVESAKQMLPELLKLKQENKELKKLIEALRKETICL